MFVSLPKPCLFPTATDISYVVCGLSFSNLNFLPALSVVIFWIKEFSFLNVIVNLVRGPSPVFTGSVQDISALLDLMLVTVRFVGASGSRAKRK